MNPKPGQYGLAGTLDGWARLTEPTARQRTALRLAYAGLSPRIYGRYGHRQWAAAAPFVRTIVKDPFALLSIDTIARLTSALPVLVYRHPAAVLASYRRMGWSPDLREVSAAVAGEPEASTVPHGADLRETERMAWFWSTLNAVALRDLATVEGAVVVSHEEIAARGDAALAAVFAACGLRGAPRSAQQANVQSVDAAGSGDDHALHRLARPSGQVASAWRSAIDDADLAEVERVCGPTYELLQAARLAL